VSAAAPRVARSRNRDPVGETSDREHEIGPGTLRADLLERLEDVRHQRAELVRLPRPDEKDSGMSSLAARPPAGDPIEVLGVPSYEHPFLRGGELEHLLVRQTGIGGNLRDRQDVVPPSACLRYDDRGTRSLRPSSRLLLTDTAALVGSGRVRTLA